VDTNTTAEIVVYTVPSLEGDAIRKEAQEILDMDACKYIFNEVSLDGVKGIGKKGEPAACSSSFR
jgi:hypothetical protein